MQPGIVAWWHPCNNKMFCDIRLVCFCCVQLVYLFIHLFINTELFILSPFGSRRECAGHSLAELWWQVSQGDIGSLLRRTCLTAHPDCGQKWDRSRANSAGSTSNAGSWRQLETACMSWRHCKALRSGSSMPRTWSSELMPG